MSGGGINELVLVRKTSQDHRVCSLDVQSDFSVRTPENGTHPFSRGVELANVQELVGEFLAVNQDADAGRFTDIELVAQHGSSFHESTFVWRRSLVFDDVTSNLRNDSMTGC
ncbi:hypothetical protein OGAPHI_003045 [Ogataea philodendri]|uniref:Uncharacterized protein n=1 Tax=Ogataea philodendri TaxID=1378263 RepID=A0A9P8T635_9ASCO|nr:uncharacterized protein OGAPHI_003045 [Ogataea philodendri]KAH3667396.1 hypothetical protein OGAPHI_003045 [Ogataea philodendri]